MLITLSSIISITIIIKILIDCFAAANWISQFNIAKNVNTKYRDKGWLYTMTTETAEFLQNLINDINYTNLMTVILIVLCNIVVLFGAAIYTDKKIKQSEDKIWEYMKLVNKTEPVKTKSGMTRKL